MFDVKNVEIEWAGRKLKLETGKIARQADSTVIATYGGTTVMCNVVAAKEANPDMDFFPLTVNYQEKYYSVGKIPGGFFKREARPTEKETLVSRLIDRPVRPLFHKDFKNETQVTCTVLSHDQENDSDVVAMVAASAALTLSGLPFLGPLGAIKIGFIDDEFVVNPSKSQLSNSKLELVLAGTKEGVLMIESEAHELSEKQMLDAVVLGQENYKTVIEAIISLAKKAAKEPWELKEKDEEIKNLPSKINEDFGKEFIDAYKHFGIKKAANRGSMVFSMMGTNYKLSNIQSALGVSQMKIVDTLLNRRIEIAERYTEMLQGVPGIEIPTVPTGGRHSYQTYCIFLEERDRIMKEMREQGIEVQIGTYSLHLHPAFQNEAECRIHGTMEGSLLSFRRALALPLFHEITAEQQDQVITTLKDLL